MVVFGSGKGRKRQSSSPVKMFCSSRQHTAVEGVLGGKHQVPLPARGLIVKSSVE